jgi:hypothetical protein
MDRSILHMKATFHVVCWVVHAAVEDISIISTFFNELFIAYIVK